MVKFSDKLMELLLACLTNTSLHQSVKPSILSTFGDMALAVGPYFSKYIEIVIHILQQASSATIDKVSREYYKKPKV